MRPHSRFTLGRRDLAERAFKEATHLQLKVSNYSNFISVQFEVGGDVAVIDEDGPCPDGARLIADLLARFLEPKKGDGHDDDIA